MKIGDKIVVDGHEVIVTAVVNDTNFSYMPAPVFPVQGKSLQTEERNQSEAEEVYEEKHTRSPEGETREEQALFEENDGKRGKMEVAKKAVRGRRGRKVGSVGNRS